jgi:hypothetical protein
MGMLHGFEASEATASGTPLANKANAVNRTAICRVIVFIVFVLGGYCAALPCSSMNPVSNKIINAHRSCAMLVTIDTNTGPDNGVII